MTYDPLKVGYLIPEFPGQTHVWMWREILHLRESGIDVRLFSTRPPAEVCRARHAWADAAAGRTRYLWRPARPVRSAVALVAVLAWAVVTRPRGLWRCLRLARSLPVDQRPAWRSLLPLVPGGCLLAWWSKRERIDHLHCHTCANGAVLAMMNRRLAGVPFSMTLNANLEWWGGAMREKLQDARSTIAITHRLLDQIRTDFPSLPRAKAVLGRIGVDTRSWQPNPRPRRVWQGPFRLVSVGRLKEGKGHREVIQAVARLAKSGRDVTLRILGDGDDRARLESLISELRVVEWVSLAGSVSEAEVKAALESADAFVLVSHTEPLGVAYMEAMALGVPTIGTTDGGVAEIIDSGVHGLLVPPRDVESIVRAVTALMDDPTLCAALAAAGRQRIVERFDSRLGAAVLAQQIWRHRLDASVSQAGDEPILAAQGD